MSEKVYTTKDCARARGCGRSNIAHIIADLKLTPRKHGRDLALSYEEYQAIVNAVRPIGQPKKGTK